MFLNIMADLAYDKQSHPTFSPIHIHDFSDPSQKSTYFLTLSIFESTFEKIIDSYLKKSLQRSGTGLKIARGRVFMVFKNPCY